MRRLRVTYNRQGRGAGNAMTIGAKAIAPASARPSRVPGAVGLVLYIALAVAAVTIAATAPLNGYLLNILMQAATYAVAVFGLTVVLGLCGQINLAQAAFFGIGAYAVGLGTVDLQPEFLGLPRGGLAGALCLGAFLGASTLRLGGHYLAMVTISFQQIATLVLVNWIPVTHGPDGVPRIQRPPLFAATAAIPRVLRRRARGRSAIWSGGLPETQLGRAMRAVRDNELAAGVVGTNVYRTKVLAFAICALLGGLGGGLFAGGFAYISPDQFSFAESIVFLTMVLLGGVASPIGAAIGTGLLILIPEWLRFLKRSRGSTSPSTASPSS